MTTLAFTVFGIPGPQGSKTKNRYGVMYESSKKVKPWRAHVKAAALAALADSDEWEVGYAGPVAAQIVFTFPRPASHFRADGVSLLDGARRYATSRHLGDLSKLVRATEDALTDSGAIADDSLIVHCESTKLYGGQQAGARVVLHTVTPDPER